MYRGARGSGAGSRHLFSFLLSASQLSLPSPLLLHSRPRGCPMGRWQAAAAAATSTSATATARGSLAILATALEAIEDRFTALQRYGGGHRSALHALSHSQHRTPRGPLQRTARGEPGELRDHFHTLTKKRRKSHRTAAPGNGKEVRAPPCAAGRASPLTASQLRSNEGPRAPRSWPARPPWERSTPAHAVLKQHEQACMEATPPAASHFGHNIYHSTLPPVAH